MVDLDVDWARKLAYAGTRQSGMCFYVIDFQDDLAPKLLAAIGPGTAPATLGDVCLGVSLAAGGTQLVVGSQGVGQIELWGLGANPRSLSLARLASVPSAGGASRRIGLREIGGSQATVFQGVRNALVQTLALDETAHVLTSQLTYAFPGDGVGDSVNEAALVVGSATWILAGSDHDGDPIRQIDPATGTSPASFPMANGATVYWYWTAASSGDGKRAFVGGTAAAFFDLSSGSPAITRRLALDTSYYRASTFATLDGKELLYAARSDGWIDVFDTTNASAPRLVTHTLLQKNGELYGIRVDPASRHALVATNGGELLILNVDMLAAATTDYPTY
jgi:hypothetical protein